jgi:hypothetical protein
MAFELEPSGWEKKALRKAGLIRDNRGAHLLLKAQLSAIECSILLDVVHIFFNTLHVL